MLFSLLLFNTLLITKYINKIPGNKIIITFILWNHKKLNSNLILSDELFYYYFVIQLNCQLSRIHYFLNISLYTYYTYLVI